MKTLSLLFVFTIALQLSHAASIPSLFNTGVDNDGNILVGGDVVDPHYTLVQSPDLNFPGPDAVTLNDAFPLGTWLDDGPDARWIAPQAASGNGEPGEYRYRTTFDLTGFDETTANITGEWGVDNNGVDILINGTSTGNANNNGFLSLTAFSITSGFVAGVNTIDFVVTNAGKTAGPTGLRVEMTGTVVVPGESPSILSAPSGTLLLEGEPFSLSVTADGTPPLSYQWQLDGVDIPGATTPTLDVAAAALTDAGDYTAIVTNAFGSATSDPPATVDVLQPVAGLFNTGVDASGVVLADNSVDPHYQIAVNPNSESPDAIVHDSAVFPIVEGPWLANNALSKWISPAFDTATSAGGDYTYRITFDLTGFDPATAFVDGQWTSDNVGSDILINGTSTGNSNTGGFGALMPFRIEPGSFVSGMNTIDFVLNNAGAGYTGLRVEGIRAAAAPGSASGGPPAVLRQPEDLVLPVGGQARFSVLADGAQPLSYQWRFNGSELGGATGPELNLFNITEASAGDYDVVITNGEGSVTSETATLDVLNIVPGVFNTGVDESGAVLADNAIDPHYTLTANANGPETDALAMGGIPSPPWVLNTATSRWIGPTPDSNGAPGLYTFQTTFDLLGFDPATVVLTGSWSSDNAATEVRLNGVATGASHSGAFNTFEDLRIESGFVEGINTLEFDVTNAGDAPNPIGLRIENLIAFGTAVGVAPFQITSITATGNPPASATFSWNSRPDARYKIEFSTDLKTWRELDDSFMSQGETSTYTDMIGAPTGGRVYYRVSLAAG